MPHYMRVKNDKGRFEMVEVASGYYQPVQEIPTLPQGVPTLNTTDKRFECTLCHKTFARQGILAIHFQRAHPQQHVDQNSWRAYMKDTYNGVAR